MKAILLASAAAGALSSVSAHAQSTDTIPAEESAQQSGGLAEIVVTAERREQRLQDVPIAITAVTGEQLARQGVTDAFDVGKITPGYNSNRVVGFGSPFMRGVGTTSVTAGDEPSVATYIDGFYQGTGITSQIPFNNVERIEVLKGPQGTLYGRNATGGLVNIITRQPSDEFVIEGSAGYANYDTVTANGYVSAPLGKTMAADLAVTYRDQSKGFSRDIVDGGTVGTYDYFAIRSKFRLEFGGGGSLTLGASYADSQDSRANTNIPLPGTVPLTTGPGIVYGTKPFEWAGSIKPVFNVKELAFNATLRFDVGFADLVSLSQYRRVENYNQVEGDGTTADGIPFGVQLGLAPGQADGTPLTPQPVFPYTFSYADSQDQRYFWTQELQLVSSGSGPFSWIVGGFFQSSKDGYYPLLLSATAFEPTITINGVQATRALAAFAQGTYKFDSGLSVTGGVRYSSERKTVESSTSIPLFGLLVEGAKKRTFNSFTYRLALDWRVSPEFLVYATANKGFKSGTFQATDVTQDAVQPETLYAYEAGFKADPSRNFRVNATAYYYDYKDLQLFRQTAQGVGLLSNAASAEMYGAELTGELAATDQLHLVFGIGVESAKYKEFPDAQIYTPSPSGGNYAVTRDASGNRLVRTPEVTANFGANYRVELGNSSAIELNGSVAYTSNFYWDPGNLFRQNGYALVDLSAKYIAPDERFSVTVWGKNVTDHEYAIYVNPQLRYTAAAFGDPATYGVSVGFKF